MKKKSLAVYLTAILVLGGVSVVAAYAGTRFGWALSQNYWSGAEKEHDRWILAVKEGLGFINFYSRLGQDRWVYYQFYEDVEDGYFVDLGSADGEWGSNSKLFETIGWNGICIDPFPTNMEGRTCQMFEEVVGSVAGVKIEFENPGSFLGKVSDGSGSGKTDQNDVGVMELTTTTLDDILERANAPDFINYMSIDIEGAEVEALKGLSFSKYRIGVFTIEHNAKPDHRKNIQKIMESNGYRLKKSAPIPIEDWYVLDGM
jgi:FkbM family methyltransferase